jgi:hypothetical protein
MLRRNGRTYLTEHVVARVMRSSLEPNSTARLLVVWVRLMALVGAVCASQIERKIVDITTADSEDGLLVRHRAAVVVLLLSLARCFEYIPMDTNIPSRSRTRWTRRRS